MAIFYEKNDHSSNRVIAPLDDHQNTDATHVVLRLDETYPTHNEDHDRQDVVPESQMVQNSNDEQPLIGVL
jgi:hypothetical protein